MITNSIGMKLVRIPAGEFMMGAEEDQSATIDAFPYADPALLPREWPRHKVRITKSFYMGQYDVTLGQFMIFRREANYQIDAERDGKPMSGYGKNGEVIESTAFRPWAPGWKVEPDHPVGYVSWNDAVAFCDWLSRKEGGGAFDETPFTLRCARRDGGTPDSRDCHDGFHVVRE